MIDFDFALKLLNQVDFAIFESSQVWTTLFDGLQAETNSKNFSLLSFILKIICIFIGKKAPNQSQVFTKKALVELVENLLQNQSDKEAKQALHYLVLVFLHMPSSLSTLKQEFEGLHLKIIESPEVDDLTKDNVLASFYISCQNLDRATAAQKALEYIVKI